MTPRHRISDCDRCDASGYLGHGNDERECSACHETGAVVVDCTDARVYLPGGISYPSGSPVPADFRELIVSLREDAADALRAGAIELRDALLLASATVEQLAGDMRRQLSTALEHRAQLEAALRGEQAMRARDAETIASLRAQLADVSSERDALAGDLAAGATGEVLSAVRAAMGRQAS